MERHIDVLNMEILINLFGSFDENIRLIEKEFDVAVINRGAEIKIGGDAENVNRAERVIKTLLGLAQNGTTLGTQEVRYVMSKADDEEIEKVKDLSADCVCITSRGNPVRPKTLGQKTYVNAIAENSIVFGIGPAGTGKT